MKSLPDTARSFAAIDAPALKATALALSLAASVCATAHPAGHDHSSDATSRPFVTANIAGQLIAIDRQSGKSRPLSSDEAQNLAAALRILINQSTEGLVSVRLADGSILTDLQGRFQNVMLARREDDGTLAQACVDNLDSAAAFFEIDPALVGSLRQRVGRPISSKLETQ